MISPVSLMKPMGNVTSIYNYGLQRDYMSRMSRQSMPETPVTPVRSSPLVYAESPSRVSLGGDRFASAYHAEQAARSRVMYAEGPANSSAGYAPELQGSVDGSFAPEDNALPNTYAADMAGRMRISYQLPSSAELPGSDKLPASQEQPGVDTDTLLGAEGAQQAVEDGKCQTCEERKYQDGSDDVSVSYQTPTNIDPDMAASAVRGHEMEHVYHEQAKADREGREVVSQTVTLHTDICPECGKSYISGGTTKTVTKAADVPQEPKEEDEEENKPNSIASLM